MTTTSKVIRRRRPSTMTSPEPSNEPAKLLSDDLWPTVRALIANAPSEVRLRAAISYVTAKHMDFARGDVLVCDASDHRIQCGSTAAAMLERFHQRGAQVYSYQGLHAKVAVVRTSDAVPAAYALVGSGNLSRSSEERLLEASLLTDDQHVVTQVDTLIDALLNDPDTERVDDAFLGRIMALPKMATTPGPGRRSTAKIDVGTGLTGREGRPWTEAESASRGPRLWMVTASGATPGKRGVTPLRVTMTVRSGRYRGDGARAAVGPDGMRLGDLVLPVFIKMQANHRPLPRALVPSRVRELERGDAWVRIQFKPEPALHEEKTWLSVRRALVANDVDIPKAPATQLLPVAALPALEDLFGVWPSSSTLSMTYPAAGEA